MTDPAKELERLASILLTKAETADAMAQECAKCKEIDRAAQHTKRADSARHFVMVCLDAARKLKVKTSRSTFTAPTWEEVLDYATVKFPDWPHVDILAWFNHFESVGWIIGKGKPMQNWKRAADNGFRNFKEKAPANPQGQATLGFIIKPDPDGWKDFLKKSDLPYKEYRYAADWVKADFTETQGRKRK